VRNLTTMFGENAGKIWQTLNETGTANESELQELVRLSKSDLYSAVGWLAREDKIKQINNRFELDATNLTDKVGNVAGTIWKILDIWDEADITTLKKLSDSNEEEVYAALGWLAREGKIQRDEGRYTLKPTE
jgi:hypothetical protein